MQSLNSLGLNFEFEKKVFTNLDAWHENCKCDRF